jgi:hypothetical protein
MRIQPRGGRGGIRTHEGVTPLPVFKTGALNHSATLPCRFISRLADCRGTEKTIWHRLAPRLFPLMLSMMVGLASPARSETTRAGTPLRSKVGDDVP